MTHECGDHSNLLLSECVNEEEYVDHTLHLQLFQDTAQYTECPRPPYWGTERERERVCYTIVARNQKDLLVIELESHLSWSTMGPPPLWCWAFCNTPMRSMTAALLGGTESSVHSMY